MELNKAKSDIAGIFNGIAKPFENYSAVEADQPVNTKVEASGSFSGGDSGSGGGGGGIGGLLGGSGGGSGSGSGGGGSGIGGIISTITGLLGSKSDANCKENIRSSYDDLRGMVSGLRGGK